MATHSEVIAILLSDRSQTDRIGPLAEGAQQLVRGSDGSVSLEAVESQEQFDRVARTTGCFRRGKAIRDPRTREVIGYELEQVHFV